ncbi:VOC family protein [Herbaspirillum lusitanum]|uniref:VOC family protein n=1 Tax=Herbaspirillum lusitanum TaxID=213312 RepID=A0ABW9AD58_9BURK
MSERIDHVVIHVEQEIDQAAAQYARLGFALTPRGHHSKGTSNHLAIFGDDYLELLGVEPHNADKPGVKWEHPRGLVGLVFKTRDADQTWASLSERDIALEGNGPSALQRPVEIKGKLLGEARFRTFRIAADRVPNGRVFFCEHGTPELVWRQEWQTHPNGATGLAEYVYVSPDPEKAGKLLSQAFGADALSQHQHGLRFKAGPTDIWYLTPQGVAEHYGIDVKLIPQGIERAFGLTVKVDSLDRALKVLTENGVTNVKDGCDRIVVPPESAHGLILAFA